MPAKREQMVSASRIKVVTAWATSLAMAVSLSCRPNDSMGYKSCDGGFVVVSDSDDLLGDVSCDGCYVVVLF